MTSSVTSSMQSMGANNIIVSLQQKSSDDETEEGEISFSDSGTQTVVQPTEDDYITDDMISQLMDNFSGSIQAAALEESVGSGQAQSGKLYANVSVTGVNSGYFTANELNLIAGRNLSQRDYDGARKVALVSDRLVDNMYAGDSSQAIGSQLEVQIGSDYYTYIIVGVYEYEQNAMNFSLSSERDITTSMYIPIAAAQAQLHSSGGYQMMTLVTAPE